MMMPLPARRGKPRVTWKVDGRLRVIAGHSASEDACERAYDPAIHLLCKTSCEGDGPALVAQTIVAAKPEGSAGFRVICLETA